MHKGRLTRYTLLTAASLSFAVAAPAKPIYLTLKDAVLLSIRSNPDVKQAELQRISDKFAIIVAKNQFEPKYTLNANAQYNYGRNNGTYSISRTFGVTPEVSLESHYGTQMSVSMTNPFGPDTNYNPEMVFKITQPLLRGFGKPVVDATLNNALDGELINRLNFKNQAITTITSTINDYLGVVTAYQQLKISYQTLFDNERTVKDDRINIAAGKLAGSEIVQAEAAVASAKASVASNETSIKTATNTLLNDLGLPPDTDIRPSKNYDFNTIEAAITGSTKLPSERNSRIVGIANNISYQTARITVRTLERSLVVAKNDQDWKLDLNVQEDRGGGSGGGTGNAGIGSVVRSKNYSTQVGLNLSVPIDDVSRQQTLVDANVGLEKAKIGLQQTYRQLVEAIDTQYFTLKNNYTQLLLSRNALKLQEQTYKFNQEKYKAGLISQTELLTVQESLVTDKQNLLSAEISYLNSIASFEQQIGVTLEPWRITVRY